jgi:hypothetical protein
MLRFDWHCLAILLVALFASAAPAQVPVVGRVVPVDAESYEARLAGIGADWTLRFEADGASRTVAAIDLAHWGSQVDAQKGPVVLLADGGRIAVTRIVSLTGDRLEVDSLVWGEIPLSLELVRGVVVQASTSAAERDRLERQVAEAAGGHDLVLLENGDRAEGLLRGIPAAPRPAGEDFDRVLLDVKGQELSIPLADISALVFNPALVAAPRVTGMHAVLGLGDGSLLTVTELREADGLVTVTLPGGVRLSTDSRSMWMSADSAAVYVRPSTPRVAYLSDLRPIGYKHVPFLQLDWPFQNDRSVLGGKLRVGERLFDKGLGMHSASRLAYELAGGFERFEAELAIDARAGRRGSVILRAYLDRGDGNWQAAYDSPVVRGGESPIAIAVDVRGARRLALIVEFADRGDECDYADLLHARLIR